MKTKTLPDNMPTVSLAKALADMDRAFGPAPKAGWLAALDSSGRVIMAAGKPAHHLIYMNAAGNGYTLAKIV